MVILCWLHEQQKKNNLQEKKETHHSPHIFVFLFCTMSVSMKCLFSPTGEVGRLLWELNPQSFSIVFVQLCQCSVGQNVVVVMGRVAYLHLKETQVYPQS